MTLMRGCSLNELVFQPAKNMIASGYTMYGASTMMVIATTDGVNGYTLDTGIGEFILTHPSMSIPQVI
jgi:fructose-1,6-bisphosphatase I